MKKVILLAPALLLLGTACTKNETDLNPISESKIGFSVPVVPTATKAGVYGSIGTTYDQDELFAVYAHYFDGTFTTFSDGKEYMTNVEAGYDATGNYWDTAKGETGKSYYWPKNGTLTFAAYSPSKDENDARFTDAQVVYNATGINFKGFTVPEDAAKQYDLMFSERSYNKTSSTEDGEDAGIYTYTGVDILFNHALSAIKFNVKTDADYSADNYTLALKSIEILNAYSTGDFSQGLTGTGTETTPAVEDHFGWSNWSTESDFVAYINDAGLTLTTTLTGISEEVADMILLPQEFDHTGTTVKIKVVYTVKTDVSEAIEQVAEIEVTKDNLTAWSRGKRYIYNLIFGLDKIYFDPAVVDWDTITVSDIEI